MLKVLEQEAEARGLTGQEKEDFVMKAVADGIAARKDDAESPKFSFTTRSNKENADAVHQQAVSDVKKHKKDKSERSLLTIHMIV